VHVTPQACEALARLLARRNTTDRCLRLSTAQGNYRFILDEPIEQDITYRYEDRVVLVVSETVSRDLWGITVDCSEEGGRRKIIFRKAKAGEPLEAVRDDAEIVPPQWRASEHERLLNEIAEIGRQIASLRGGSKSLLRDQLHVLEAAKQEKWDAIRTLWAGDGGWHKRNGNGAAAASRPADSSVQ
jgi:Fe-S cluster assembly iron-binding protein IscA